MFVQVYNFLAGGDRVEAVLGVCHRREHGGPEERKSPWMPPPPVAPLPCTLAGLHVRPAVAQLREEGEKEAGHVVAGLSIGTVSTKTKSFITLFRPCLDVIRFTSTHMCWGRI